MVGARATSRRTRVSSRLMLWSGLIAVALAGCSPSSNNQSSGGSGGNGNGGAGGSSAGGTAGSASGGSGGGAGSGGSAVSGGSSGKGGSAGSAGGASGSGGKGGSGGTAGAAGGSAGGSAAGAGGSGGGSGGTTTVECTGDQTECYGVCVDLKTNPKHCGKCGIVCAADECNAGACKVVKDCFKKTVISDPVVADFEGYDGTTVVDEWGWAFNAPPGSDKAVYAGLYEYDDGTGSPTLSVVGPGNGGSKYAAKLATSGQASKWGGGFGVWMSCVDASAYQGISFWVKGTTPRGTGTMTIGSEATSEPSATDPAGGGTCTSGTCASASLEFPVTSEWTKILANWDSFTAGTANGSTVKTTGGDITGMGWNVGIKFSGETGETPVPGAYDIQVDDVEFIGSTPCEGTLKLCDVACVDTTKDIENCGTCGNVCTGARTCSAGKCVCPSGYTECGKECVDTQIDAQNCGGCTKQCTGVCSGGTCQSSTCAANMPQQNKKTNKGDNIDLGKYFINNNWWGDASASGSQSIWSTCSSGNTIGWGTEWNWSGGNGVISYASAVLGWHYGWKLSNTGLPVQLSAGKKITCGWTYRVQPGKVINVSYDLFAHTQSNPGSGDNPSDEIMIWLYRAGGAAPIGGTTATVNLAGTSWELHEGNNGSWQVHSYVRTSNADTGATINISDFLNDLTSNRNFSKSKYLTSIQAGTEVYQGGGRLDTDQYYCTIQ